MSSGIVLDGRYEISDCLGSGAMAQVFRAHDRLLGRDVAVKLFGPGIDPNGPARARSEMRTLAGLSHPNLVVVHDAGTDTEGAPPRAYLVMQLVDGPSLAELMQDGPLPDAQVRHIGVGIANALAYVHDRSVVHRDIKPGNILLDRSARPFLADFGIAQTLGASALTATGLTVGTAAYLSPEQVRGRDVGPPSDVYSLGLVLLEALTGEREYPGTTVETALARLTRPPVVLGRVPLEWRQLLGAMTATDPAERATAAEVAGLLTTLEAHVSPDMQTRLIPVADGALAGAGLAGPAGAETAFLDSATVPAATRLLSAATLGQDPALGRTVPSDPERPRQAAPTRVPARPTPHDRRRLPTKAVAVAAGSIVAVTTAIVVLNGNSGSTRSPRPSTPAGTPGPGMLSPDLTRLSQLVQP